MHLIAFMRSLVTRKTRPLPFKNFTSIIGPNGMGKSNLMDAISFVLSVMSAIEKFSIEGLGV
jgi:structural maintenance of chromosome 1